MVYSFITSLSGGFTVAQMRVLQFHKPISFEPNARNLHEYETLLLSNDCQI